MAMLNPPHPGEILREDIIPDLGVTVTEFARNLGMGRVSISRVINEHAGISPQLAVRLEQAGLSTARFWLSLQMNYDLSQAQNADHPPIRKIYSASSY